MTKVEIEVGEDLLAKWEQLAEMIDIELSGLIKVAMSQIIKNYRMDLKRDSRERIQKLKVQLDELKAHDPDELKVLNISSKYDKRKPG